MYRIAEKLMQEDLGFQYNWEKRFKALRAEIDIHPP